MPSLLETTQPTNAFFLFPYAGALFTLFENTHSPDFVSTITLFIHLAILSITKDQKELCIWFEKKYYFWNEVSLRLKAFKIKWSIEQHFRQFHASKYLLQLYKLPQTLLVHYETLPKARETQALTALTSNFGLVVLVQYAW